MTGFFKRCQEEPSHWQSISQGGLERVHSRYTWSIYASRMLTLTHIYSFWRMVTNLEREEAKEYLDLLYRLLLRPMMRQVPSQAED